MTNLNSLLKILVQSDIQFVLVGGFAAVVHGASQITHDIDLCLVLEPTTIQKLRILLKDLSPKMRGHPKKLSFLEHPESIEHVQNLYLQTNLGPLDLLTEIKGIGGFEKVSAHAISIELYGATCKVISIQDLITAKYAMGREKDIAVAKELEAILSRKPKF